MEDIVESYKYQLQEARNGLAEAAERCRRMEELSGTAEDRINLLQEKAIEYKKAIRDLELALEQAQAGSLARQEELASNVRLVAQLQ